MKEHKHRHRHKDPEEEENGPEIIAEEPKEHKLPEISMGSPLKEGMETASCPKCKEDTVISYFYTDILED